MALSSRTTLSVPGTAGDGVSCQLPLQQLDQFCHMLNGISIATLANVWIVPRNYIPPLANIARNTPEDWSNLPMVCWIPSAILGFHQRLFLDYPRDALRLGDRT
jgi:hypothetical protein